MAKITVWTKQNEAVLEQLERDGRYIAREEYMRKAMEDTTDIMLLVYRWLAANMPTQAFRPGDAKFPIWVSPVKEATMLPEPGQPVLELSVDEELIAYADITKWTSIINYAYIPKDEADNAAHNKLLTDYGISDAKAIMTPFYPQIKRIVMDSWSRLFDESIVMPSGSAGKYGLLWEVRKEWITNIYM